MIVLQQPYSFQTEPGPVIHSRTIFNIPTGIIMFQLNVLIHILMEVGGNPAGREGKLANACPAKTGLLSSDKPFIDRLLTCPPLHASQHKPLLVCMYNHRQTCPTLLLISLFISTWIIKVNKKVIFSPMSNCLLVGWLVCQQNNTKSTEQISAKRGWRTGAGTSIEVFIAIFFTYLNIMRLGVLLNFVNYKGKLHRFLFKKKKKKKKESSTFR